MKKWIIAAVVLSISVFSLAHYARADVVNAAKAEARSYVKEIVSGSPTDASVCSAVIIAPGKVLTAKHCNSIPDPHIKIDNGALPITDTIADPDRDLMVATVPGLPCPCAATSSTPAVIDEVVYVIGFPYGISQILTEGTIQGRVKIEGREHIVSAVSAAPGNSGGGLFVVRPDGVYLVGIVVLAAPNGMIIFSVEI